MPVRPSHQVPAGHSPSPAQAAYWLRAEEATATQPVFPVAGSTMVQRWPFPQLVAWTRSHIVANWKSG